MSDGSASQAHDEYVLVVWEVTESRGAVESLAFRALHDPLTGLANRSLLSDRIERAVVRARRDDSYAAVLFCDLDRFKVLNDSLGHDAGDIVLRVISSRLTDCVRSVDTVGRLGGDEFVVVCEGLTDPNEARILADRIIAEVSEPVPVGDSLLHMSTSIGIAVCNPDSDATAVTLRRDADIAMYRAKSESRGAWSFFDVSLREQAVVRQQLEEDLR